MLSMPQENKIWAPGLKRCLALVGGLTIIWGAANLFYDPAVMRVQDEYDRQRERN